MKILSKKELPFSEQVFQVEMTGLQLAALKFVTGCVMGSEEVSLSKVTAQIYDGLPNIKGNYIDLEMDGIENIYLGGVSLEEFTKKVNANNI